jgi:chemotaxis protein methyltransferase CheR
MINDGNTATILLSFEDVTHRHAVELEKANLLKQKETLLAEMQHRIVNSLQIIASILMMKARAVSSDETREHLQDAHRRVMSVAAVQQHLQFSSLGDLIEITPYLTKLCESLSGSMIGESRPATLVVTGGAGARTSTDVVSLGLIVTELVINALKYAFPDAGKDAAVTVHYEEHGTDWTLSVTDNGIGKIVKDKPAKGGLGTSLVNALANQLDAKVVMITSSHGMSVVIAHESVTSLTPMAA